MGLKKKPPLDFARDTAFRQARGSARHSTRDIAQDTAGQHCHQENLQHMKTTEKTFDAVKFMREQRDKLSKKLAKMTKEEILEYFKKQDSKSKIKPSA